MAGYKKFLRKNKMYGALGQLNSQRSSTRQAGKITDWFGWKVGRKGNLRKPNMFGM